MLQVAHLPLPTVTVANTPFAGTSLAQVDLSKRYGCLAGGVNDIKSHPWFRPLDFTALKHRTATPPIR